MMIFPLPTEEEIAIEGAIEGANDGAIEGAIEGASKGVPYFVSARNFLNDFSLNASSITQPKRSVKHIVYKYKLNV